jgi:hypothetical protein
MLTVQDIQPAVLESLLLLLRTMADWDRGSVYASQQRILGVNSEPEGAALSNDGAARAAREFVRNYRRDAVFVYR